MDCSSSFNSFTGLETAIMSDAIGPRDVVLKGIFIHPAHLSAGFCADDSAYPSSVDSTSTLSYDDDEIVDLRESSELSEAALETLALDSAAVGSATQDATQDYFAPRPALHCSRTPLDGSSMYSGATSSSVWTPSACSTAATTPTAGSPGLVKGSTMMQPSSSRSGTMPATFSFASFTPNTSAEGTRHALPRAPSPSRPHPYHRLGSSHGTAMLRSVSSPVETQRQHEERQRRLVAAEDAMDTRAVKMARSKSGASTPAEYSSWGASASAPMTRRPSGMLVSPLSEVFGRDWGKALPPRPVENTPPLAFPYNVARPPVSPLRNARSRSFAGLSHPYEPASGPSTSVTSDSDSSTSAATMRALRPRSRLSVCLGPLTPIQTQSVESSPVTRVAPDAPFQSTVRGRLQRGMSF